MTEPTCPDCDGLMVQRTNRKNGTTFWGCTAYPRCKGTRAMDQDAVAPDDKLPSERHRRHDAQRWREEG